ncbi:hypothetical protein PLICRDRAFT_227095 [Plicaturopsis crispa FD-325 SS-3]|nr:hypothetical protein PLICRDRAFT_227095 [Plicaturopsis crispa FD-325 SS-3]
MRRFCAAQDRHRRRTFPKPHSANRLLVSIASTGSIVHPALEHYRRQRIEALLLRKPRAKRLPKGATGASEAVAKHAQTTSFFNVFPKMEYKKILRFIQVSSFVRCRGYCTAFGSVHCSPLFLSFILEPRVSPLGLSVTGLATCMRLTRGSL